MTSSSNSKHPDEDFPTIQNYQHNKSPVDLNNDPHVWTQNFPRYRDVFSFTVEFGSSESDNSVNFPVKNCTLFAALRFLDPSLSVTIKYITINHPGELPMGTKYTENFEVITDKKSRYPYFFVHHEIYSKIKLTALKFGDHNIV